MADRGYIDYNPQAKNLHWLRCAQEVIEDYRANWPLTVRQVFYRMVASYGFPKLEKDYKALAQIIARARRASSLGSPNGIPWEAIRSGRGTQEDPYYFGGPGDFVESVEGWARGYRQNRWDGQAQQIELWCEAEGMVPTVVSVAQPYSLRVSSGGGYDSVTAKHKLANRVSAIFKEYGLKTIVLHVGDFDPSGDGMWEVMREDVAFMVAQQCWEHTQGYVARVYEDIFDIERVGLTGRQVIDRGIITAPPKDTDSRMAAFLDKHWEIRDELGTDDIAAQLEALEPPELVALFDTAIRGYLDEDVYNDALADELSTRNELVGQVKDWRASL
jgi:hypothetical protein